MLKKIVPCIQGTLLAPSAPGETPRSRDLPPKFTINYPVRRGYKSRLSARRVWLRMRGIWMNPLIEKPG